MGVDVNVVKEAFERELGHKNWPSDRYRDDCQFCFNVGYKVAKEDSGSEWRPFSEAPRGVWIVAKMQPGHEEFVIAQIDPNCDRVVFRSKTHFGDDHAYHTDANARPYLEHGVFKLFDPESMS